MLEQIRLRGGNFLNRFRRTVQSDGALVALFAECLIDLQEERPVAEGDATVDAFSATDAQVFVDDVLEVRQLDFTAANRTGRTELVFRTGMTRNRLRIEKARTEIAVTTQCEIVETFDRRNGQHATVSATAAADTALRINLPSRCIGSRLFFDGKEARQANDSDRRRSSADRSQKFTSLCVHRVIVSWEF